MDRVEIRPGYSISRIIKGGWHLAGGHGQIDKAQVVSDMLSFVESGITTFDCADIYTGVEDLIGIFLKKYRSSISLGNLAQVQVHTKYVPDYAQLSKLKRADTELIIDRSLKRLNMDRLDVVQFAWWDYSFPGYVETAVHLQQLQQKGKIRYIGVTNFNHDCLCEILDAGVKVVTNQVQYSVLDQRAGMHQQELAHRSGFHFLTYGTVAGGFLSDKYLRLPEPSQPLENRSLTKYKLIIEEFGSWSLFQELLEALHVVSKRHDVAIAEVAIQYVLQKEMVGGVIVGARNKDHLQKLLKIGSFKLDEEDIKMIESIRSKARGPSGSFYDLERDKEGKHGSIMKYNLNSTD